MVAVSSRSSFAWPADDADRDDLEQLFKLAKSDALEPAALSYREWGLLYLHLPETLPDVHPEEIER